MLASTRPYLKEKLSAVRMRADCGTKWEHHMVTALYTHIHTLTHAYIHIHTHTHTWVRAPRAWQATRHGYRLVIGGGG